MKQKSLIMGIGILLLCIVFAVSMILITGKSNRQKQWEEQLNLGNRYLMEQDYESALVAFNKLIEIDPKNAEGYLKVAEAYVGLKDYENAVEILNKGYQETGDGRLEKMKEEYERYLRYAALLKELAELCEKGIREDIWNYITGDAYQEMIKELEQELEYCNNEGIYLRIYPCGHLYYGDYMNGKREGLGIWVGCCNEHERFGHNHDEKDVLSLDFFRGEWKDDCPNGMGEQIRHYSEGNVEKTELTRGIFRDGYGLGKMIQIYQDMEQEKEILEVEVEYGNPEYGVFCVMNKHQDSRRNEYEEANSRLKDIEAWKQYKGWMESLEEETESREQMERFYLITKDMYGGLAGFYDIDQDDVFYQYNPEMQYFLAGVDYGKGVGIGAAILDKYGKTIVSGFVDELWMTEQGYVKIKYFYIDSEKEMNVRDMMAVVADELDGCAYAQLYDWSGELIESTKLGDDWTYWEMETERLYPQKKFNYESIEITYEQVEDGIIIFDTGNTEVGHIAIDSPETLDVQIVGNLMLLNREHGYCEGIYWIEN